MPLKIEFKSGDKLIINGAVVENVGSNTKILIHNESAVLREKEVLSSHNTKTPAARVYYALQCAYIFPQQREKYLGLFRSFLHDYITACPSATPLADAIFKEVEDGRIYKALKESQRLIVHEGEILSTFCQEIVEQSGTGTPPDHPQV